MLDIHFFTGYGINQAPSETEWVSAIIDSLNGLNNNGYYGYVENKRLYIRTLGCVFGISTIPIELNVGINLSISWRMSFIVNIVLSGDCSINGSGAAVLEAINDPFSTTAPFFYEWVIPYLGTGDTKSGLSAGTYVVRVNDSTAPNNLEEFVNVNISSGICSQFVSMTNTSCGFDNGILNVTAPEQ